MPRRPSVLRRGRSVSPCANGSVPPNAATNGSPSASQPPCCADGIVPSASTKSAAAAANTWPPTRHSRAPSAEPPATRTAAA